MKDELFPYGERVPMTKGAVRALALSKPKLYHVSHLIDIGVGTGSVPIEVALQYPGLYVVAIERNPATLRLPDKNRQHFACANIDIFPGVASMTIAEKAGAIFMGDSGDYLTKLIDWSMHQSHSTGRLVMMFTLQENLNTVLAHLDHLGIQGADCLQLQVSSLTTLSSSRCFKSSNPVFVTAYQKKGNHV